MLDIRTYIQKKIAAAFAEKITLQETALLEIPRSAEHGDLSANVAMQLAKPLRSAPRKIAEELIGKLDLDPDLINKVEIAGPGFINFTYAPQYLRELAAYIKTSGDNYGSSDIGKGKKVNLEFVSANPTGPLNVVSARAAALGDSLKRLLNFSGYEAKSEFYVNDAGFQIFNLVHSLLARYAGLKKNEIVKYPEDVQQDEIGKVIIFPKEGYRGEYLIELAQKFEPIPYQSWDSDWQDTLYGLKKYIPDEMPFQVFGSVFRHTREFLYNQI